MERSYPTYLASRSFSVHDSLLRPLMVCDDEHMIFWGFHSPVRMAADGDDDGVENVWVHKFIILTMQ